MDRNHTPPTTNITPDNYVALYNFMRSKPVGFIYHCKETGAYSLAEFDCVHQLKREDPAAYLRLLAEAKAVDFPAC